MFEGTSSPASGRTLLRAVLCHAGVLGLLLGVCWLTDQWIDMAQLRAEVAAAGPAVPVVWVLLAGLLGAVFVPGPLLGTTGGALCGPVVGCGVNFAAMVVSAVIASSVGRFTASRLSGSVPTNRRWEGLSALRETYGVTWVVVQRLTPVLPDAPSSYAFGACGLRLRQILLGTLIGSPPWALIYALLGSGSSDLTGPAIPAACGLFLVVSLVGFVLTRKILTGADPDRRAGT